MSNESRGTLDPNFLTVSSIGVGVLPFPPRAPGILLRIDAAHRETGETLDRQLAVTLKLAKKFHANLGERIREAERSSSSSP